MKAAEVMITYVITVVEKVLAQLQAEAWTKPSLINVIVQDGTVELRGIVDSAKESCPRRRRGHPRGAIVRRKRGTDADDFDLRQRPAVANLLFVNGIPVMNQREEKRHG